MNDEIQQLRAENAALRRRLAELTESRPAPEEKYRQLVERSWDIMTLTDAQGRVLYVSESVVHIQGYSVVDYLERNVLEHVHPDDLMKAKDLLAALLREPGVPKRCELRTRHKEGHWLWMESIAVNRLDDPAVRAIVANSRDITIRRRAQEELCRLNEELEQRVQQRTAELEYLYNTAPCGYHSLDADGVYVRVNDTELCWLGYSREEIIGCKRFADLLTPASRPAFEQSFTLLKARGWLDGQEFEVTRKDGATFQVLVNATSDRDAAGNFLMSRSTLYDITERKQVEAALRRHSEELSSANEELARAARLKDEFLASMSHELRTPLTGILGFSDILQKEVYGLLTDKQLHAVRSIETSGQQLLGLINDLLDLSKIEAGKLELQLGPVSALDVCQVSLEAIKEQAQSKQQEVLCRVEPAQGFLLQADPRRLVQILVNLLSNAVKFTPAGGQLGLEAQVEPEQGRARFSVWDKGIGIAPENLNQLFQLFVQLDARLTRVYSGTGLGLALVRRLTEMHGGGVAVESALGEGSRFTVWLPWRPRSARKPL